MAEERIQKILARAGIASRRKAEELIVRGRVRVDGKLITELGAKADPKKTSIELDGKKLEPEPLCYGVLHKPRGMVTTLSDPEGRPTARQILRQVGVRVVPVGRLDFNTSGALLFTNDGDFAQAIQHARGQVEKVYAAKVTKPIDERTLQRWTDSIDIDGKRTKPASVRVLRREGTKTWLEVTITEGKNRQVRRLGEHARTPVDRLARLTHAGIGTEGLKPGEWRLLTIDELKAFRSQFGVPAKIRGVLELPRDPRRRAPAKRPPLPKSPSAKSKASASAPTGTEKGGAARRKKPGVAPKKGGVRSPSGAESARRPKKRR